MAHWVKCLPTVSGSPVVPAVILAQWGDRDRGFSEQTESNQERYLMSTFGLHTHTHSCVGMPVFIHTCMHPTCICVYIYTCMYIQKYACKNKNRNLTIKKFKLCYCQAWWSTSTILCLKRMRQGHLKFMATLGYIWSFKLDWTIYSNVLSLKKKKKSKYK